MLSLVEHEKSFITSEPGLDQSAYLHMADQRFLVPTKI